MHTLFVRRGQTVDCPREGRLFHLLVSLPLIWHFYVSSLFKPFLAAVDCLVRKALWSLCLCLSLAQLLLCLCNVLLSVLKHFLAASGIISHWSGRPFHAIVWRPSELVGEIIIQHGLNRRKERELHMWGRARGFALTHTQHHSLYINPYLIRLSHHAPSALVYPWCVVLRAVGRGKDTSTRLT